MIGTGGAKLVLQSNSCAERITYNQGVVGSNPAGRAKIQRLSYRWAFSLFSSEAIQTRRVDV